MAEKKVKRRIPPHLEIMAFTVPEFATAARISTAMLYKLWRQGKGPPFKMIGVRRVIEVEAGRRWVAKK